MAVLASALRERGAEVHFACAEAFEDLAVRAGARFVPLTVTRNANTGVAETTRQESAEAARLAEFLEATRFGAIPTLTIQARHRRADMLADPDTVFESLRALDERLRPDWYVVDQLSYAVTLALHCLRLRYASFCPGHPTYIPAGPGDWFGVPYDWPAALRPDPRQLAALKAVARSNDRVFTALFEAFIRDRAPHAPSPGRAFALTSPHAVLYSYPQLPWLPVPPKGPERVYAGHMVSPTQSLDGEWAGQLRRLRGTADRVVLIALGTFLSARDDVLRAVVTAVSGGAGRTAVIVAAGGRTAAFADLAGDRIVVAPSVPQQALLPHVDAMVHHGGANSFTECIQAGVPALILPFSSDQFAVARDAERAGVGLARDPNALTHADTLAALEILCEKVGPSMNRWVGGPGERGPDYAAVRLMAAMDRSGPAR
ncbi:glycosyltransferase [Streptomyces roseus]|uniref:glycosyltransferase n=1 Tax=Streptomyces roseus TaxID=66430 RepID=UPI003697C084